MSRWRPPTPSAAPYITAAGYRALELELERLAARRVETVRHLAAAAAEGDRSENAEYIYRKKELREIDRRLGYLQRRMPNLTIVAHVPATRDRVFFGAWVELEDTDGKLTRHRIVGGDEIGQGQAYISVDAPLAQALLKRGLDDQIVITTPRGEVRYTLLDITYEHASD